MEPLEQLLQAIEIALVQVAFHKEIAIHCQLLAAGLSKYSEFSVLLNQIKASVCGSEISLNYLRQIQADVQQATETLPFKPYNNLDFITQHGLSNVTMQMENNIIALAVIREKIEFNFSFFTKLGFFRDNIVAVGANGSGKTMLSNELKKYLTQNGVIISAQKILLIPTFSGISNYNSTLQKLQSNQTIDKSNRTTYTTEGNGNAYGILVQLGGEFQVLLDNLLAERSAVRNKYCDEQNHSESYKKVPTTKLDRALEIWNSLLPHRKISCEDGININLVAGGGVPYPAYQMSDGEKVTLFLIAQVIQAPVSGFIVIDEPEMYLHKTILNKLWDFLERERQDCIFIYLTHDLDFAESRTRAKKVWIKSFDYPDKWEIDSIPQNELPEALLFELLGSRKNILFCEGKNKSLDKKIFECIFPKFTIIPVSGCFDVINYTKSFNKLPNTATKAFGVIDADYHSRERLDSLIGDNVFSYSMAEIENLFFDPDFLKALATQMLLPDGIIDKIKDDVIVELKNDIEIQVSNYVSTKANYYFNDSHMSKGNCLSDVRANYDLFVSGIRLDEWHDVRKIYLEKIIEDKNYRLAMAVYNNKGLKKITNKHFKISDFTEKAIRMIEFNKETHRYLQSYFPVELH